ncbi:MAG: glucuronate isomerase, partial [Salinivirgaceae bacterium]|nr:glucuronate isomerase [Salinivirgaceae bacterium]
MKTFITDNFLLKTKTAQELYHNFAKNQPIIDYHSHLIPQQIAENRKFDNIAQIWLSGDHYKWRAMRANGINERFVTGNATDREKFDAWAQTVPYTLRNPLYHWTHLELKLYFGIDTLLNPESADEIWNRTSEMLKSDEFSVWGMLRKMNVETACTTDDPIDNLQYHKQIAASDCPAKILPTWRP